MSVELPEAYTLSKQMSEGLVGKEVFKVLKVLKVTLQRAPKNLFSVLEQVGIEIL